MANLNLKTLEWEGLDNVYYVHEVADEYDPTQTYEAGEYCTYLGVTYRAKADISTAEAWTAAHWEATTVGEELTALNEQFEEFTGAIDNLSSTDVAHNASAETYTAGTVGAELASQSRRIDGLGLTVMNGMLCSVWNA